MSTCLDEKWLSTAKEDDLIAKIKALENSDEEDSFATIQKIHQEFYRRRKEITLCNQDGRTVVSVDGRFWSDLNDIIKDWPLIISNEKNLKILADLNMCDSQKIIDLTNAICKIFESVTEIVGDEEEKDAYVHISPVAYWEDKLDEGAVL